MVTAFVARPSFVWSCHVLLLIASSRCCCCCLRWWIVLFCSKCMAADRLYVACLGTKIARLFLVPAIACRVILASATLAFLGPVRVPLPFSSLGSKSVLSFVPPLVFAFSLPRSFAFSLFVTVSPSSLCHHPFPPPFAPGRLVELWHHHPIRIHDCVW